MAGLMKRLLGGRPQQGPAEPAPGVGGYHLGQGPANQSGPPGTTSQVRINRGKTPRDVKVRADTDTGFEQGLSSTPQVRQASYRGDIPGAARCGQRGGTVVATPQPKLTAIMQQNSPAEFYGGPMLKTGPGNNTAGAHPLSPAQAAGGHSKTDTTTPYSKAGIVINSGGAPGAENVRNEIAQRYKYPAGILHSYRSAPRADQAPVNHGGQNTDGNVHPDRVVQAVTVPTRLQLFDGGNPSWAVLREMPYGGRGNGARGADLNGQRFYATGQADQFWNGGQGSYGIARQRGSGPSAVAFTQPAPWSANAYTTTASVGTADAPNTSPGQQPQAVYVSPRGRRASNSTGRRG